MQANTFVLKFSVLKYIYYDTDNNDNYYGGVQLRLFINVLS